MIVLLIGGPFAGRVIEWPDLPPSLTFPIMRRPTWRDFADEVDETDLETPCRAEYVRGRTRRLVVGEVTGYRFKGHDPYGVARTMEKVVAFAAPTGLAEVEARAMVEALLEGEPFRRRER